MKKKFLTVSILVALCCLLCFSGFSVLAAQAGTVGITLEEEFPADCAKGENVVFPDAEISGIENGDYRIQIQKDGRLITTVYSETRNYTFTEVGEYKVYYIVSAKSGEQYVESFSLTCSEKPYIEVTGLPNVMQVRSTLALSEMYLIDGDQRTAASLEIISPSETSVTPVDNTVTLGELGTYLFIYSAEYQGQNYSKTIRVQTILSPEKLFIESGNIVSVEGNTSTPSYAEEATGVLVTARNDNSVVTFANTIDLSTLSPEENVVAFQILSGDEYVTLSNISIRLTDVNDENNSVTVRYTPTNLSDGIWNYAYSYMLAGFGGNLYANNTSGGIYENNYGHVVTNSFHGNMGSLTLNRPLSPFQFQFNYQTNEVLTITDSSSGVQNTVIDLDDSSLLGNDVFGGFSTGEVRLEIIFPNISGLGGIIVTECGGVSLAGSEVVDTEGPQISLTAGENDVNDMPKGVAGTAYPLPDASAYDAACGLCNYTVTVKKDNATYPVNDNSFLPDTSGNYQVVYTASDLYGNESITTIEIEVASEQTPIEIDIPEVTLTAGSYFSIPEVTVTGGSGHIDYSVQLLYNGTEVFADENGEVFLDAKGTFSFVVHATDYLGQEKTLQTNLTVNVPQEPVMDIPSVPSYAETGTKIIFPDFTATDYYTAQDCVKEIYVNGKLLDEDREYEVTEEAGSYLTVEYYAYSQREVAVRSFSVYVFDTESVIDYFMTGNNVERELSDRGIIFSSDSDFTITVPFAVFADEFLFTLRPNTEANAFGYVDITLSDSVDPSVYVNLRITPNGTTASWLQINGCAERYTLSGSLQYGESGITLMWDNESLCFRTSSGTRIAYVLNRADGKVFHGFESGKVNISISVGGVYGNASLIVYQIANQMFNSMSDIIRTGAQITYADAMYNRKVALYDTVTVPAAEASDPFCMDLSVTVSVSDPSGNIVLASSSADTHYSFRALEYGIYTITYVATSSRGSTTTERYSYTVTDYDPPVISVSGVPSSVKSGKSFTVPNATVTDNVSEECTLYIFVRGENLRYTPVTAGEKLSLDDGIYLLVYYAVDDAGNFTRREFEIVVG